MRKRQLVLDFTSLLDVIMILLFIIISNMSQASLTVTEEAKESVVMAEKQLEALNSEREDLLSQLEGAKEYGEEYEQAYLDTDSLLKELQGKYDLLQEDYDYLKIVTGYDSDDTSVYEEAIKRTAKVILICDTDINEDTGNQEVKVNIYLGSPQNSEQAYVDSIKLVHDFNLSKDEREKFNAGQVIEVTKAFMNVLRDEENNIIWFSVQYEYDDENFSYTDLAIISEAVENLERVLSKSCYIEEIKLY